LKLTATLLTLSALVALGSGAASADTIDEYSLSVTISESYENNPFAGQTYTGTFFVDEQTDDVTNFSADLLNSSPPFSAANLGDVANFTGGVLTSLSFGLTIHAPDGSHSSGFTSGFSCGQIVGLNCNNYFAYLNASSFVEGGGTPVFTKIGSSVVPEPATWVFSGLGIAAIAFGRRRKRAS
jgi:hypothetical protein